LRLGSLLLLIVVAAAVYAHALGAGFVWDDNYQILRNPSLRDISYLPHIFTSAFWDFLNPNLAKTTHFYRPMQAVTYMAGYFLFDNKPWGFHLINVLFHIAATLMVYVIARRLLQNDYLALAAGLLFAAHPIHTESVTWIAGVTDVNCAVFYFLSFYLYLRAEDHVIARRGLVKALSFFSFFVALLCKEMALTLPAILIAYEYSYGNYSLSRPDLIRMAKKIGPYFFVLLVYTVIRISVLGFFSTSYQSLPLSWYQNLLLLLIFLSEYVKKLVLPIHLNAFHMFKRHNSLADLGVLGGLALLIGLGLAFYKLRSKEDRRLLFLIAWIFITLVPVLNLSAVSPSRFAERYLYIPSLGFCLLLCALADRLIKALKPRAFPQVEQAALACLLALLGFYSAQTMARNFDWKDNITLYSTTIKASPYSAHMRNNLALEYVTRPNASDMALSEFQEALNVAAMDYIQPPGEDYQSLIGIGVAYFRKGRYAEAQATFEKALEINPAREWAYSFLAAVFSRDDSKLSRTIALLHKSLAINPNNEATHDILGVVLLNKGDYQGAVREFTEALRIFPDYPDARQHLQLVQDMLKKSGRN
jgi:tetratricopeptide (TPR) repeat protein